MNTEIIMKCHMPISVAFSVLSTAGYDECTINMCTVKRVVDCQYNCLNIRTFMYSPTHLLDYSICEWLCESITIMSLRVSCIDIAYVSFSLKLYVLPLLLNCKRERSVKIRKLYCQNTKILPECKNIKKIQSFVMNDKKI